MEKNITQHNIICIQMNRYQNDMFTTITLLDLLS